MAATKAEIREATTDEEIKACFPVIQTLRPHIKDEIECLTRVRQQQLEGYHLHYIKDGDQVQSILGYRILNFLYSGKSLYIDDLCTLSTGRGKGYGGTLLDWINQRGKDQDCDILCLDSGFQRNDAHRLYLQKGYQLHFHHFQLNLK